MLTIHRESSCSDTPRRGAALVVALICVLLVSMIATVLVKTALVQRDQVERGSAQAQADQLIQSGLERALSQLKSKPDYAGETWLPARADGTAIGRVAIDVSSPAAGSDADRGLRITVDVPDDPVRRSRVTRSWRIAARNSSITRELSAVIP